MGETEKPATPEVDPQRPFANPKAIAEAIAQLSPDDAQLFIAKLDQSLRRNRLQAMGYLAAVGLWLIAMVFALVYYGAAESGHFVGWVFLLPFAVAGATLYIVGRLTSDR